MRFHRLRQMGVHTGAERTLHVIVEGIGRHGDDGYVLQVSTLVAADGLGRIDASMTGMRISMSTAS